MNELFDNLTEEEARELSKVFYSQAYETVENLQDSLMKLDVLPDDAGLLREVKRYFHTLKGDSNTFGLTNIGTLCHRAEDVMKDVMEGSRHLEHDAIDLLQGIVDVMNNLLLKSESGGGDNGSSKAIYEEALEKIEKHLHQEGKNNGGNLNNEPAYTEYQELQMDSVIKKGLTIYDFDVSFHKMCGDKGLGALMIKKQLEELGEIILIDSDIESDEIYKKDGIKAVFASNLDKEELEKEAAVVGVTDIIVISPHVRIGNKSGEQPSLKETGIKGQVLRVDVSKVDRIMDLVGELIIGRSMLDQLTKDISEGLTVSEIETRLFITNSYMERTVSDLQKGVMRMRMVQVNQVFRKFPKIVRDLSLSKGKHVRLDIFGREKELDKGVVDALGEPLSHIIRNMLDHGIESPDERMASGKPDEGIITLKAYHEAAQIVIEASDDGRGIDTEKIKAKAVSMGLFGLKELESTSEKEIQNLIFLSGLTTSDFVSETSGRGVGMDAVKSAIEGLKGSIEVESAKGKGTIFRLRLPLTLAVMRSLLFSVSGKTYAVPMTAVHEVTKINPSDLTTVEANETLMLRGKIISLINLKNVFYLDEKSEGARFALILSMAGGRAGIMVDEIVGQQELVIKAVDERYSYSGLVSGASILGNGKVILILDATAIFTKAVVNEKKRSLKL